MSREQKSFLTGGREKVFQHCSPTRRVPVNAPCAQLGSRREERQFREPSLIEFGEKGTRTISEGVQPSGVGKLGVVLPLLLESIEDLEFGYPWEPLVIVLWSLAQSKKETVPLRPSFSPPLCWCMRVLVLVMMPEGGSTRRVSSKKKQRRNNCGQKTLRPRRLCA